MRAVLAAASLLIAVVFALARSPYLVISSDGEVLVRYPVGADDSLELDYTHSIYDVPVHEVYRLTADRGLILTSAASSAAALEYSALWPTGYLPDGTPYVALERTIGALELSVDRVGRPKVSFHDTRLDLGVLLGAEGRVRIAQTSEPVFTSWLDSVFRTHTLVAESVESGGRLWEAPVLAGELFAISYTVATYSEMIQETFAIGRDNSLTLRQASYGSGALAADCSVQCDRLFRTDTDFGLERSVPFLVVRLPLASHLVLQYRGTSVSLASDNQGAVRLRIIDGPAAWVSRGPLR